jgi:hypothetical protein
MTDSKSNQSCGRSNIKSLIIYFIYSWPLIIFILETMALRGILNMVLLDSSLAPMMIVKNFLKACLILVDY